MTAALENALVKSREKLLSGALSEAQVSQGPVRSILQALGWYTFDVDCVVPEYSVGSRRVDYALKASSATPDVFLEIKAPSKADADADRQLFEYAFHVGVPFAVLTDGRIWNFYLPSGQGDYQERRLFRLDVVEMELSECCQRLDRYLGFDRVRKGVARNEAAKEYDDRFRKNKIKQLVPKVWKDLLAEPDDLLCDALIEAVEAESGERPARADVEEFLKAQAAPSTAVPMNRTVKTQVAPPAAANPVAKSIVHAAQGIGFRFQDGNWQSFTSGKQCYVAIIRQFVQQYPDFAQRFQNAKSRGKRAWIARSPEELFPGRSDFQTSEATEVGAGWLVGTQMSAQVEMPKRIEAACACVGLVFGRDLVAKFL
ncbi:MAG: hypothetical protein ACREYA_11910 [Cupriavidus necator]